MIVVYVVIARSALIADAALSAFGNNKVYHTYFNAGSEEAVEAETADCSDRGPADHIRMVMFIGKLAIL